MNNFEQIIKTKLRLPFTRSEVVPRLRLQKRIAEGLHNPLTLVIAPAGYGKTTLLAASLPDCCMPVAWLSLDRDDNQPGRFLSYLITAIQAADNQIGIEAAQLASQAHQVLPETILTSLINDLDGMNREMVLALDDYQFISNPDVHAVMAFLLEHLTLKLHLLIASRSDPPLPLSRLRARGQMVELRAADLRFTAEEAARFMNDVMDIHLDAKSVSILEERTEGWIAGLQMAALSMRNRADLDGFIAGFSGTNRHILDYLMEEILSSQTREIQHFLLYTSICERLTAPLCDAILAEDNEPGFRDVKGDLTTGTLSFTQSASVLESLERENIFLIALDDERTWFRYHHLFADLLRARLHQSQPEVVRLLHMRASVWLEQYGLIIEAIHHLLTAGEINQAADLIERYGPARLEQGDPSIFRMADNLPPEMLLDRPKIGLYQAWFLIVQGHIRKAIPLMNDMMQHFGKVNQKPGQQWMQTVLASGLAFLAPPNTNPEIYPLPDVQQLDDIPAEELILRNATDFLYGMALARRGENNRAVEISLKNIQREKRQSGEPAIPTLAPFLTRLYLMMGKLNACASLCREFLDPIKKNGIRFVYTSGSMKIDLGEVMYEWNHLDEAEQYIRDGLLGNEPWQNIMTDGFGLAALTRVLLARGNFAEAMQVADQFEEKFKSRSMPREFDEDFHTLKVRLQLASGDTLNPYRWADQIQNGADFESHKERYCLTLARIHLAQGRYSEAEKLLTGMPPIMTTRSQVSRQIECNLLLADAIAKQNHLPEAFALIETCLALAEPEGYLRVFLDVGKPAEELVSAYLRKDTPGHKNYAQKVMQAFSTANETVSPGNLTSGLIEVLSERELEVLRLIATGNTNQEIANQLFVATGTVKAHTASIFRKLAVTNRTEAVARARQLGLLS